MIMILLIMMNVQRVMAGSITRGSAWNFEPLLYCADGGHEVGADG
jgi:hypothetical protein